jgi:pyruvate/2-oxoglutarate dehydrogenase complex dihydrolipoamide acyltransferase (E2) component
MATAGRQGGYRMVPNPKIRRWNAAAFRSVHDRPMMHALVEVDVTAARELLRDHKAATGESVSFTAFIVACVGRAVDENRAVQAFRKGRKRLVLFDDVDVYTMIERDVGGQMRIFVPDVVRAVNRKTLSEIHAEVRAGQVRDVRTASKWLQLQPDVLFVPYLWAFSRLGRRYPQVWKKYVGTVGVTAVGMFGRGAGWGVPPAVPTLMVTVGGIGERPAVADGRIVTRDHLSLTISFDHNIVDGAPAARFTERLKELIESGYGLGDLAVEPTGGRTHAAAG